MIKLNLHYQPKTVEVYRTAKLLPSEIRML